MSFCLRRHLVKFISDKELSAVKAEIEGLVQGRRRQVFDSEVAVFIVLG